MKRSLSKGKNSLNREKLLEKEELEVIRVDLGKDEFVYVKQMNGREREAFEKTIVSVSDDGKKVDQTLDDFRAKLAVRTVCDENGVLLLKPDDYETLSCNMSAARLTAIADAAGELNKISEQDKEDLVKN